MFDRIEDFIIRLVLLAMILLSFVTVVILSFTLWKTIMPDESKESTHKEHYCTQIENKELT